MHALVLGAVALSVGLATGHAEPIDTAATIAIIHERAAAWGQSGVAMERLARCESRLDTNAVGDRGHSVGLFQIHDQGLLSLFRQWGYDDRADAWQASDFVARALAQNMGRHWSCWRR